MSSARLGRTALKGSTIRSESVAPAAIGQGQETRKQEAGNIESESEGRARRDAAKLGALIEVIGVDGFDS